MSMIAFRQATKRFGDHLVLHPLTLGIESGEVAVVIGPSGSGKSTMLRCINVLETISGGDLHVDAISVQGSDAPLPLATLGRAAAARGDRAGASGRTEGDVVRRADLRARP
jgi:ABC-type polar amino acid transport system ATPase subunit